MTSMAIILLGGLAFAQTPPSPTARITIRPICATPCAAQTPAAAAPTHSTSARTPLVPGTTKFDVEIAKSSDTADTEIARAEAERDIALATVEASSIPVLMPTFEEGLRLAAAGGSPVYFDANTGIFSTGRPMFAAETLASQSGNEAEGQTSLSYTTSRRVRTGQLEAVSGGHHRSWTTPVAIGAAGLALLVGGFVAVDRYQYATRSTCEGCE